MKKSWLAITAIFAVLIGLAVPKLTAQSTASESSAGQTTATANDKPTFEVVSIKPHRATDDQRVGLLIPPGRFTATNVPTKLLIEWAYNGNRAGLTLRDDQLLDGPSWINSGKYDVDARVQDSLIEKMKSVSRSQWADEVRLMVQSVLTDRFKLKVHHETRELPEYVLVLAKNGPKLTESTVQPSGPFGSAPPPESGPPSGPMMRIGSGQINGAGMTVGALADALSHQRELGGREIVDQTGLKGSYDFTLQWTPEITTPALGPDSGPPPDPSGPSIFTAIQEQLGLKLESTKGPVDVLIIDHIEEPTPN